MKDFSYNISEKLTKYLEKIDEQRFRILTTAISPKDELRLRWEAHADRISASFAFSGQTMSKQEIIKLLATGKNRKFDPEEQQVIDYKRAFDYLMQNWLVSKKNVSVRTLINIHGIIAKKMRFPAREEEVRNLLDFLQSSREHCVIVSGIAHVQFLAMTAGGLIEDKLARLLAYLFMYKSGYDFRGLLKIEEYWRKNQDEYKRILNSTLTSRNLTIWLEYYAGGIIDDLTEVEKDVSVMRFHLDIPAKNWDLNDRQREIMIILEQPEKSITNRGVQQLFKVSQITASRDLARLEALGIIFAHGKGRSVYYTKV